MTLAVFRIEKSKDYTVMSNHHLKNSELSLRAKGLLSQILSLPEGWDYTIAGLAAINKEGKDAVRAAVLELEKAGYIVRRQKKDAGGKFGSNEYVVYESPVATPPLSEKSSTEKPTQLNKDLYIPPKPPTGGGSPKSSRGRGREYKAQAETLSERFERFWQFYRDHVPTGVNAGNRQKAIRAWDKLAPDDALATKMAKALAKQVETQVWKSGVGVPHASTWLNNHGWEDDWGAAAASAGQPPSLNDGSEVEWAC